MATYTRFSPDDVVITTEKVFTSTWTNNTNKLTVSSHTESAFNPGAGSKFSTPSSSGQYFIPVHNVAPGANSEVQYTISYGHKTGLGSEDFHADNSADGYKASRGVYSQYRA